MTNLSQFNFNLKDIRVFLMKSGQRVFPDAEVCGYPNLKDDAGGLINTTA